MPLFTVGRPFLWPQVLHQHATRLRTGRSALVGGRDAHWASGGRCLRNHHANPDDNPGSSASRWFLVAPSRHGEPAGRLYASVSIPCCNLGPEGGGWPTVGRAGAEMISGRVGSTKGRTRIFAGLLNSQPSGHATVGQGAERRPMARSMVPPTSGHRRVSGLAKCGSPSAGYSPGRLRIGSRSDPFRPPPAPHALDPIPRALRAPHDEPMVNDRAGRGASRRSMFRSVSMTNPD
jgi:hypothetical protein